jgi:dTDP-4-dehydrorhamnose 3,5-epimerase
MPFDFQKLQIPDVILITPQQFKDARGFFMETYTHQDFAQHGIREVFVQVNQSRSARGVLRGLHYQKNPFAQGKLVRAVSGEIFDVAVDIRRGSPFFGRWVAERLSAENAKMLYVPRGFAHGFLTLSAQADVEYLCTKAYQPDFEHGIIYHDPDIAVAWPLDNPVLSDKDAQLPSLKNADNNFVL